jgi:hypothetical protein
MSHISLSLMEPRVLFSLTANREPPTANCGGSWSILLTMKWSNRIAQGFSPGWSGPRIALKVAAEKDASFFPHDQASKLSNHRYHPASICRQALGRHFQRDLQGLPYPGLKPWADLLDHSMVKSETRRARQNRQPLTENCKPLTANR